MCARQVFEPCLHPIPVLVEEFEARNQGRAVRQHQLHRLAAAVDPERHPLRPLADPKANRDRPPGKRKFGGEGFGEGARLAHEQTTGILIL